MVAPPSGALAADFIASVSAGNPCGTEVLERRLIDALRKLVAAENEVAVWDETRLECELAVRSKEAALRGCQGARRKMRAHDYRQCGNG